MAEAEAEIDETFVHAEIRAPAVLRPRPPMAVLSTNLVASRTRQLADMIETLPVSLAPEHQYERCCELLEQVAIALDLLVPA